MKILLAEDDINIRTGLKELLQQEGYQCCEAENGERALQLYEEFSPDLVLLDIMMPLLDGYSVCRAIRKTNEEIPVIFLTAKSEEIDQVLGLELGADDYIKKPFGKRELIARIRAVTRRCMQKQNTPKQEVFWLADLKIIPAELRVQRGEHKVDLSLRDMKILMLLQQHQGKVVDRDMLFNYCWGRDYLPSSRTLDQHISKLRKLIEIDPKKPEIIRTVHGLGYRYDAL